MKKIVILSVIVAGLVGCSSSNDAVPTEEEIALALLNGVWTRACEVSGTNSLTSQYTFNNGAGNVLITEYPNLTCADGATTILLDEDYTYSLGDEVTLDGSVEDITSGNKINFVYAVSPPSFGIYAIKDLINLYLENTSSTDANRPTQISDQPFALQP